MSNGDAELHQTNLKRSASVQWLPTKRAKSYPQEPKHFKPSPDPGRLHTDPPLNKPPTRGVYCVGLPLASRDSPTYETELWGLITEATNELARQNKRLVRTPQVLSDGIIFDWVLDFSKSEAFSSPLGTAGALGVQGGITARAHTSSAPTALVKKEDRQQLVVPGGTGNDATNAIVIVDSDEEFVHQRRASSPLHRTSGPVSEDSTTNIILDGAVVRERSARSPPRLGELGAQHSKSLPPVMPAEDVDMLDIPTHVDHNSPSGDDDTSDTEETDIDQNILPDRVARQLPDPLGDDIEEIFRAGDVSNILARHGLDAGRGGRCREASSSHTESSSSPSEESDRESPPLRQIGRHRQKSGPSSWNGPHRRRSSCPEEARPPASKSDALRAKPRSKPQSQRTAKSSKPSSSVSISSADAGYAITIPKADFARGRRILGTESDDLPLVTVSMRGDIHLVRRAERDRISQWSIPAGDEHRHVEDACVVGDTVVVGHNIGPCQVSVINLDSIRKAAKPHRVDVDHIAHSAIKWQQAQDESDAPPGRTRGRGISCLAPVSSQSGKLKFVSGGHDKRMFLWTIQDDGHRCTTKALPVFHQSSVHAVAYRSHQQILLSSAGSKVYEMNMVKPTIPKPIRVSNSIRHIHAHREEPNLIVLEVDHLDQQIQIFDVRKGGFNRAPCFLFGARDQDNKPQTRYRKGSSYMSYFSLGYNDGSLRIWDYRKPKAIVVKMQHRRPEPIVHTMFSASDVVAYGSHVVTFWDAT